MRGYFNMGFQCILHCRYGNCGQSILINNTVTITISLYIKHVKSLHPFYGTMHSMGDLASRPLYIMYIVGKI